MGKKIRRAIGAMLMAIAIAVTQLPVSDVESEGTAADGAAETASVSDFQVNGTTLVKYNGTSENVSVSNYVEKIESEAFAGNEYIRTVTIGDGVLSIGSGAFKGCSQLQSVAVADSVETIGQAAFADCPSLSSVQIGKGLKELGNGAFAGDSSLAYVDFDSKNQKFVCSDGAIYSKENGDTLYALLAGRQNGHYAMPAEVSSICAYAFWGNKNLQSVDISGNVNEISAYAFSNCCNLKLVNIPYSVRTISLKAFEDCVRLRNITIPISVSSIHSTAFDGCTKLNIHAEEGSVAKTFADTLILEDIEVAEYEDTPFDTVNDVIPGTNNNEENAAEEIDVDYYHEVTHMNPLESEEDASVKGKSRILDNQVFVFVDNASATVNTGEVDITKTEGIAVGDTGETIASISGNTGKKGSAFPKYTIVNDTVVADQAYYQDGRTFIEIAETVTEIGDFAFARSALTNILIPEGVTHIGYAAFYHCEGLTDVVIPSTVVEIEPSAFAGTAWFQNWEQSGSGDFLIVGDGILLGYRGGDSIVSIPEGVKTIGADAFASHMGITKIIIPDSVETIGEGAFAGCGNLAAVEGGQSLRRIKDRAFQGCPLQNIKIPASVEEIGLRAYDTADSVKEAGNGIVIFEGTSLPKLSYEASSGKLYNDAYRGLAFDGIHAAVVPKRTDSFENTVLDSSLTGFRGVICNVDNQEKSLKICQMQLDGASLVSYPDVFRINTTDYTLDKVQVPRTENAGQTAVSNDMTSDALAGNADTEAEISIHLESSSIENEVLAGAVLNGVEGGYLLRITDSNEAKKAIQKAYQDIYGNKKPANLLAYEITLQETDTSIPITGLGRQEMEITIPFPKGIGAENLHVVCLDANGQLEEAESRITSVDGVDCITFTANHFSAYGIYNYLSGNTAVVHNGQAVFTSSSGIKDVSPDTGDYSIHPKWFLGVGLFFTGLAMFLYKGRKFRKTA